MSAAPGLLGLRPARTLLIAFLIVAGACAQATTIPKSRTGATRPQSSLTLGTNLALYDTNDQVVNNPATQRLLKVAAIPIIRMPFRFFVPDEYELQALRAIQRIGAIPLVIIHGPTDPNALANDRHAIALVQRVFGASTVYVEFGNEADLAGVTVWTYINAWNAVIPELKELAPTYKFVGPANFQADPIYVATFDKHANPRPAANTWHEYACQPSDTDDYCLAHISDWSVHIRNINKAVRAAIGVTLPLMMTEWNLDAEHEARYANSSFMRAWTARALRELAANISNGLLAAMQYCVTNNGGFDLIDENNTLTPQGQVFIQALRASAGTG